MRMASCSFDISSEKTATPQSARSAACSAMFSAEGGLAHARPAADDDEVGRLQPGRQLVEIGEAGRHAGDRRALLVQAVDLAEGVAQQRVDAHEGRPHLPLGDGEDLLLGALDQRFHVLAGLVAARGDARCWW